MALGSLVWTGCAGPTYNPPIHPVESTPGRPTVYEDPQTVGRAAGVGIESQDVISMTDQMVADMLSTPVLSHRKHPARIIIDSDYFRNEGSSRVNKNMITDRLRVELNRAAQGRMVFVGRVYSDMVEHERSLKREPARTTGDPLVDPGTLEATTSTLGGDYRLGGRITTIDLVDSRTGLVSRAHQIIYEMVDLETGEIVWSGIYDFKKTARDDVIYR
ncbi:MAG: penicillin-binding protein activator LpoB [Nitrospinaceae bacterium]|nr:penicillin-binding protein activator LpoB [Nitrospinaceae bacterium]